MFRVLLSDGNRDEMLLCVATNILNVKIIRCRFVRNFIRIFEHHITAQCHKDQTGQQVFVQLLQKIIQQLILLYLVRVLLFYGYKTELLKTTSHNARKMPV